MGIRIVEFTGDSVAWDRLVGSFPGATAFHTSHWLGVLERTFGQKRLLLKFVDGSGRCVGVLPLVVVSKAIFKIAASPLRGTTGVMGPLLSGVSPREAARSIEKYCAEKGFDYVEMTFTSMTDEDAWRALDFECQRKETYRVALGAGEKAVWSAMTGFCRNRVRKAEKSGVVVAEGGPGDVDEYYSMLRESFGKSGIKPTTSKEFVKNVGDTLVPQGLAKFLFAEHEGKRIAGAIFLTYGESVYFWNGAALTEYNKLAPNNLLHWHIMKWGCENGYKTYDMAGKGIERLDQFKETFGPEAAAFSYVWKANNFYTRFARNLYQKAVFALRKKKKAASDEKDSATLSRDR